MPHNIEKKIAKIRYYLDLLEPYRENCAERFKSDTMFEGALLHYLYLVSDSAISLAEMVIKQHKLMRPDSYYEAIDILGQHGLIPRAFAYDFAGIAGFRNFLAHDYERIDPEYICEVALKKLDEVKQYLAYIEKVVQ